MKKQKFNTQDIPDKPGVYVYRNSQNEVIYVGKAKSLRKRMSTYFQESRLRRSDPKLKVLIKNIFSFEFYTVKSESEALLLESRFIKQYHPKFNVELRDDKRFLLVAVNRDETYPRLQYARLKKDDNRDYYGPFPQAGNLRLTIQYLEQKFGIRTCNTAEPTEETLKHCLERRINTCSCPCAGKVSRETYLEKLDTLLNIIQGRGVAPVLKEIQAKMLQSSEDLDFEKAAEYRDLYQAVRAVCKPDRRFSNANINQHTSDRSEALKELQVLLEIRELPAWIECFDISHISNTHVVGSMVCFQNGKPHKKEYRHFRIKSPDSIDDTRRIAEVVSRRYTRRLANESKLPDLIVIDGGVAQVHAAIDVLIDLNLTNIPLIGLAKKEETIIFPGDKEDIVPDRSHKGLQILQAIRDEAHRFAISYNRELRKKRITDSLLDEIEGIGPKRRQQLLKAFGSAKRISKSDVTEIVKKVPGIGQNTAEHLLSYLKKCFK